MGMGQNPCPGTHNSWFLLAKWMFIPQHLPMCLPACVNVSHTHRSSGWWYTYPSEKYMTLSVGVIIPFPTYGKSVKIPWFQLPPTSHDGKLMINIDQPMDFGGISNKRPAARRCAAEPRLASFAGGKVMGLTSQLVAWQYMAIYMAMAIM